MTEAYAGTDMAKAAATKQRRANLTDFERYKVCTLDLWPQTKQTHPLHASGGANEHNI